MRTAEGLGVSKVFLTGYTPYPQAKEDRRLPHIAGKVSKQISKTALGAEAMLKWQHSPDIEKILDNLRKRGFTIAAVEQSPKAIKLTEFKPPDKLALIVGREVEGLELDILDSSDLILEIPMLGNKESFNVVQAAAMVLYHCRWAA